MHSSRLARSLIKLVGWCAKLFFSAKVLSGVQNRQTMVDVEHHDVPESEHCTSFVCWGTIVLVDEVVMEGCLTNGSIVLSMMRMLIQFYV
jgi:hypothetical protein